MKKIIFALATLTILLETNHAQLEYVEIIPTYGYHFGGKIKFVQGDLKIIDQQTYGVTIALPIDWGVSGELSWSRSDSRAEFYSRHIEYDDDQFEMASNYFMLSGMKELGTDPAKVFGGLLLGAAWFDSKDSRISDLWRFSFGLGAGFKYMMSEKVGLRFQGRLLIPMYLQGGGFFCGIGGGGASCGVGVGATGTILQGDLSAGLIIRLGND